MAEDMSIDKKEPIREASEESMDINSPTPEPEAETGAPQEGVTQQKRKGGRKPIYATSEERKQRNRQAQAAFRERRTEYIKQLEDTIRVHETNLHNLQTAHRSAADECLMLRYKNSLLERILLEKGIDVQAELRAKTGSPHLGPTHMPNMAQAPTVQRAIMNRHQQARRSNSSIAPKLEPGASLHSPQSRPTPSSHASSPTSLSPGFLPQGVMTPPASESQMQYQQQQQRLQAVKPQPPRAIPGPSGLLGHAAGGMGASMGPKRPGIGGPGSAGGAPMGTAYYPPSANYQSHMEHIKQLEQEYDAQADMVDDQETESGPGPYPEPMQSPQQQMPNQFQHLGNHGRQGMRPGEPAQVYTSMTQQLLDPYDPMLDMDPFGLSASMQFPSSFSFDTSSMR
ncbi:related to MEAB protein [Rhynchosporium secalis]|uniref:Related to MEAB protein n=1 Tax=Rhynchosporium secalis TaxID=38038 RepID=A0A1E1MTW9_RHYSE|nr:related to MEAB protein [Rhynchosporium secalis]